MGTVLGVVAGVRRRKKFKDNRLTGRIGLDLTEEEKELLNKACIEYKVSRNYYIRFALKPVFDGLRTHFQQKELTDGREHSGI